MTLGELFILFAIVALTAFNVWLQYRHALTRKAVRRGDAMNVVLIDALNVLGSRQHLAMRALGVLDRALSDEKPFQAKLASKSIDQIMSNAEDVRMVMITRMETVNPGSQIIEQVNFDPDFDPGLERANRAGEPSYPLPVEG